MTINDYLRMTRPVITLGALVILAACSSPPPAAGVLSSAAPTRPDVVVLSDTALNNSAIVIEPVKRMTRSNRILAPGLIALDDTRTARIGSLQEGRILETHAQVGDRVRPRQVLATLYGRALDEAWAAYRIAIADRRRLDKELAYAVEVHERAGRLYASKAIPLQELQRADVERVSTTQMIEKANAEVSRSIKELAQVGISVTASAEDAPQNPTGGTSDRIPIRSPIGGVVLERLVTTGTTVSPATPLFVVSDLSALWAIAEIDESQLSRVRAGRPVEVVVAAYPNERFSGTIAFIGDTVNPKTRRITVRSTVPNTDGRLKPEMFATVALGEGEPHAMVVVPQAAIQTIDGRTSVFVAEADGRFRLRAVDLGPAMDGLVEVASGLAAGERVVVAGSFVLKSELLKPAAGGEN